MYLISSLSLFAAFAIGLTLSVPVDDYSYEGDDVQEPYSKEWRDSYDDEALARQPKWRLADKQPKDRSFEVREYEPAWWVSSHTPCFNQTVSVSFGYLKLYLYVNKYNYQRFSYPLTYPILSKIELGEATADEKNKDHRNCNDRYSQNFYLPIYTDDHPAATPDESISTTIVPARTYYVKSYSNDFSPEFCNDQAGDLAKSLVFNGVKFNPFTWYCAQYEPGQKDNSVKFEVWFEG